VSSESGLPDDLSWGRLGYIRWLDTAQDLCHSKATHPLDHTDFTPPNAGTLSFETTHNRLDFLLARPERTL